MSTETKSKGRKNRKNNADPAVPVVAEATGDAVGGGNTETTVGGGNTETTVVSTDQPAAPKRIRKNHTGVEIRPDDLESAFAYLEAFRQQSEAHPPRKGYDQHWNSQGFIHMGPAARLPNRGATNMVVLIGDILAKREEAGDADAGKYLDFCIKFLGEVRQRIANAREAEIERKYQELQARRNKS